MSGKVVH